jgi:hypothetical protein
MSSLPARGLDQASMHPITTLQFMAASLALATAFGNLLPRCCRQLQGKLTPFKSPS